jgi:hypothetical protein
MRAAAEVLSNLGGRPIFYTKKIYERVLAQSRGRFIPENPPSPPASPNASDAAFRASTDVGGIDPGDA